MDSGLFYTLGSILIILYFVAQSFEHWEIFQLGPMSLRHTSIIVSFFEQFAAFWHYMMHQIQTVVSVFFLESAFSPRSLRSFYWRMIFKDKIWVLGMLIVIGVLLILGPSLFYMLNIIFVGYCYLLILFMKFAKYRLYLLGLS